MSVLAFANTGKRNQRIANTGHTNTNIVALIQVTNLSATMGFLSEGRDIYKTEQLT